MGRRRAEGNGRRRGGGQQAGGMGAMIGVTASCCESNRYAQPL
jgi:hypothetical protein